MNSHSRIVIFLLVGAALVVAVLFGRSALQTRDFPARATGHGLRLLTYSTFVGPNGPGGKLIADFKRTCLCDVEVVTAGDAGLLLQRLDLSRKVNPFDVVIGVDQLTLAAAEKSFHWQPLDLTGVTWVPEIQPHVSSQIPVYFAPIDWAPMTFIYRKGEVQPPQSLDDLTRNDLRGTIALEDPRLSTPGLQFLNWIIDQKGESTRGYLEKLRPNIQSVSPSWSLAYGMFADGQAKLVFSYLTSLVYHWQVESDHRYQAASFASGHPYQVEFVGIPQFCHECLLAQQFVKLLVSKSGQDEISRRNFMFPAVAGVDLAPAFHDLPVLKLSKPVSATDLKVWQDVFQK